MFEIDLQQVIYTQLTQNGALMAMVSGVYDHLGQNRTYPYIHIGEDDHAMYGFDIRTSSDALISIDVWSQYNGTKEIKDIFAEIRNALHEQDLADVDFIQWISSEIITESDGITKHGIIEFRVLMS